MDINELRNCIWYIEARPWVTAADGKSGFAPPESLRGSAVAVKLFCPVDEQGYTPDRNYLLTCGHVVRGDATFGNDRRGWGELRREIWCFQHGAAYSPTTPNSRTSGEHSHGYRAEIHRFSPCGDGSGDVAEDRRKLYNDWVLLDVTDDNFQYLPAMPLWDILHEADRLSVLGFPGGPGPGTPRGPASCLMSSGFNNTRNSPPGMLLLDGPDETRKGMSGGAVLAESSGAFIALHRAGDDDLKSVHSIPSHQIRMHLRRWSLTPDAPFVANPAGTPARASESCPAIEPTTPAEIKALKQILSAAIVSKPNFARIVAAIHHLAIRPDTVPLPPGARFLSLAECLRDLKSRVPRTLILFVEVCTRHLLSIQVDTDDLDEWLDAYRRRIQPAAQARESEVKEPRVQADRLVPLIAREAEAKWRVHMVLKPVMGSIRGQEKYQFHYALREEGDRPTNLLARTMQESTDTLPELKKKFADFFENIRNKTSDGTIVLIDVIVPIEVLFACSDRWEIHDGELKRPVGRRYSTVMRSYERRYPDAVLTRKGSYQTARDLQKQKWPESIEQGCASASLVKATEELCDGLFEFWSQAGTKSVVALTLTAPPDKLDDEHRVAERLVSAGIPLAFWLTGHAGGSPKQVQESMDQLVQRLKGKVTQLPNLVREWSDADNAAFQCNGISLLWDNHDDPVPQLITETFDNPEF